MIKKILSNPLLMQSFWSLIARFTGVALNFAVILIITNLLPKSSAGDILLLMTFVTGVALISRLGIDQLLMKEVAGAHHDNYQFKYNFLKISYKAILLLSIVFMGIWVAFSGFLQSNFFQSGALSSVSITELMVASLGVLFFNLVILNSTFLKAIRQPIIGILGQNALTAITFLMLILVFWRYFTHDQYTIYLYIASLVLAGILAFFITQHFTKETSLYNANKGTFEQQSIPALSGLLKKSLPLAPISIISFMMIFTDTIMVGWFLPNEQVAEYSVASKISYILLFFLQAMEAVIYPRLLNMFQHQQDYLRAFFWQATALVVGVVLSITLLVYLLADPILSAFGEEYIIAKQSLGLLLIAQFLRAASLTFSFMFIIREKISYLNIILFFAFFINIVCNIIFIQQYGIEGAALATLIANAVLLSAVLGLFFKQKLLSHLSGKTNSMNKTAIEGDQTV